MKFNVGDRVKYKRGQAHYIVRKLDSCNDQVYLEIDGKDEHYWAEVDRIELITVSTQEPIMYDKGDSRHRQCVINTLNSTFSKGHDRSIGRRVISRMQGYTLYGANGAILEGFTSIVIDKYNEQIARRDRFESGRRDRIRSEERRFRNPAEEGILAAKRDSMQEQEDRIKKRYSDQADLYRSCADKMGIDYATMERKCVEKIVSDPHHDVDAMRYMLMQGRRSGKSFALEEGRRWHEIDLGPGSVNYFNNSSKGAKETKMQKTINKLNGLKLGEEQIVELTQEVAQKESFSVSLFSLLKGNKLVDDMGFGKDSLLQHLELNGENLVFKLTKGSVEKEENVASIQELIRNM